MNNKSSKQITLRKHQRPHFALLLITLFSACAHHRDVRPGSNGVHRVAVRAVEKSDAERSAVAQAEHYCDSLNCHYVIISENTQYTGSLDENTRNTLRRASQAASFVGNQSAHPSDPHSIHSQPTMASTPARTNTAGTLGAVGTIMTNGEDYLTQIQFKCE
jgi:hypothetical protein